MKRETTRREFITRMGLGAAAIAAVGRTGFASAPAQGAERKKVLTVGHLTDIHVQPERAAGKGLVQCLHHVQQQTAKPDIILNGGDCIMDSLEATRDRTALQWKLWQEIWKGENSLPVVDCIGNHDIFGWNHAKSGATGKEADYGKQWGMDALGLESRYYSLDRAGWHFVVLDSTHHGGVPGSSKYIGKLDEEQFDWFEKDLAATDAKTPVLVLSHIPILSAAAYLDGENEQTGDWVVPGAWMHIDARRIKDLFLKHSNVRVCLSGHLHLRDRVEYNGVTYLCNGAVSGNWWRGINQECDAGYALVDLYDDGSFENEYVNYGWVAQPDA